jgi:CheY-like chemotaxis protein
MRAYTALVIEDDAECSELLEMVLFTIPNLDVEVVRSGCEARKRVEASGPYSLLITDFHLPAEDGLTVVESIRAMPGCAGMPFLVVTSCSEPDIRRRAEVLGASAFFRKPFSPVRFREAVHSILNGT